MLAQFIKTATNNFQVLIFNISRPQRQQAKLAWLAGRADH
jgi:hypothetical protein